MGILQVSTPKTGSFWLHTLLRGILERKGIEQQTYITSQPEYSQYKSAKLSFKEQASVDMVDIQDDGYYYRISSLVKKPILDIQEYITKSDLTWTHSTWCTKTSSFFQKYDKKVIIVRDPRDRALSAARFAFSKYMQKFYPNPYSDSEDFLSGEYENLLDQWVWFYGNYLLHAEELDLHFVFFENLLVHFDRELEDLLAYLGMELEESQKKDLANEVAFARMKTENPDHLQKGKSQKWITGLNPEQKLLALKKAGPLMEILGYPTDYELPETRKQIEDYDSEELREFVYTKDWKVLF